VPPIVTPLAPLAAAAAPALVAPLVARRVALLAAAAGLHAMAMGAGLLSSRHL
jgi:hypothetical protein